MAQIHTIQFYPVGNGDTSQIITADGKRFLFDYYHTQTAEDSSDPRIDLKARLKKELKEANRDYFDVVAFTHSDLDHICGSTDFFELEHADKYKGGDRTKIKELWLPAAMLLEDVARDQLTDEFALWRKEGRHRLLEGKGIKVFSKPERLMEWLRPKLKERGEAENARDHLFVDAGQVVNGWTLAKDSIEFFCHSPFVKHCDDGEEIISNDASLIFNVRLQADGLNYDFLQIGDSTWEVLEDIVSKSKKHGNVDRLKWDLFNIPHHCSYRALSDEKGDTETEPKPLVKELLLHGKPGSYEVSSSDTIDDSKEAREQKQPPHIQARKAYETNLYKVGGRHFVVTMEHPNRTKPEPLKFEIRQGGVSWVKGVIGAGLLTTAAAPRAGLGFTPVRAG